MLLAITGFVVVVVVIVVVVIGGVIFSDCGIIIPGIFVVFASAFLCCEDRLAYIYAFRLFKLKLIFKIKY